MQSKWKMTLLACLLVAALLLSGCSLVKKDMAVDAATEIIKVGEKVFTKAEVQEQVTNYLNSLANYYYQNYGYTIDTTDASLVAEAQETVTHELVEEYVVEQKAVEYGVSPLSDEAKAEVADTWSSYYDLIKSIFFSSVEVGDGEGQTTEEDLDAQVRSYVAAYMGVSESSLEEQKVIELLKAEVVKDVTVSDEEIQADFDAKVEEAKTSYESNLSAYGTAVNSGSTVYYRPAGYRMVKQILVQFNEEDQNHMDQLEDMISAQQSLVTSITSELNAVGLAEDVNVDELLGQVDVALSDMDFSVATLTDLVPTVAIADEAALEALNTETADVKDILTRLKTAQELQAKYEALLAETTENAYAHIDERADEVLSKIAAGEDWGDLVAEYNDDPGMNGDSDTARNGYAICENMTGMDTAFTTAGMAIPEVGGTSDKTRGSYGYYIIKYFSDVAEGPVDLADVRDTIESALLTTKQDEFYTETVESWVDAAGANIDLKSLND